MKSVCIAGASGFIGSHLKLRLQKEGFTVNSVSRDDFRNGTVTDKVRDCSIVINLVGESIVGLWTRRKRKRIYDSRVLSTRKLVDAINKAGDKVELLIQISGVAIYDQLHAHTEESRQFDDGFLSRVIRDWEGELGNVRIGNIRLVILRLGVVLDKNGGMLKKIMVPLKFGIGFAVKSEDYFPFIRIEDLLDIFMFSVKTIDLAGVVNVSAPVLTKINQFFKAVFEAGNGKLLIWFNRSFVRLLAGEGGSLLTDGQQVIPAKLIREGFVFRYDNIEDAMNRTCI